MTLTVTAQNTSLDAAIDEINIDKINIKEIAVEDMVSENINTQVQSQSSDRGIEQQEHDIYGLDACDLTKISSSISSTDRSKRLVSNKDLNYPMGNYVKTSAIRENKKGFNSMGDYNGNGNGGINIGGGDVSEETFKESVSKLHEKFSQTLLNHYGRSVFDECLCDITLVQATNDLVTFETASPERRDMIGRHYLSSIKKLWQKTVGPVNIVTIKLRPDVSKNLKSHSARAQTKAISPREHSRPFFRDSNGFRDNNSASNNGSSANVMGQGRSQNNAEKQLLRLDDILSPIDERNNFDNFAVDASNQVAYAAAKSATGQKGSAELIYLYGKSGLGKTHLLHAMALQTKTDKPNAKTAYLAYNNIASGCVNAMLSNNITALHREFLGCDIVLIDDIHLLVGKEKTQEQILAIIDACLASGCHVAVAGEPAPIKLGETGINRRLSDRLSGGLSVAVMSGGPHLRFDVLKKRLMRSKAKCTISEEALDFIVRNFTHSMRETIGAMNQLLLVYGDRDIKIDLSLAKTSLRSRLQDGKRVYTLDDLLTVTSEVMGVSEADMKGKARPQPIARARHAFVYCAREILKESLPRISATLLRDHTTALSSVRRAAALLERDKVFCRQVEQIREKIEL